MKQFEQDYNEIKKYVITIKKKYPTCLVEADDIINDTYIKFVDEKKEYSFEAFKKEATVALYHSLEIKKVNIDTLDYKQEKVINTSEDYKVCRGECKQMRPKDMYCSGLRKSPTGQVVAYEFNICRVCNNAYSRKRATKLKETEEGRAKIKEANRKHIAKGKNKEYKRKGRKNLDNWYIIETLSRIFPRKTISTDEIIIEKCRNLIKIARNNNLRLNSKQLKEELLKDE
jgi:hypothetical protein